MAFKRDGAGNALRKSISLLLAICMLMAMAPASLAASVGTTPASVTDSTTKSFVKLSSAVSVFTTTTLPTTGLVSVPSGTVLMLVSENTYTATDTNGISAEYGCLYYNNVRYNVLWSAVSSSILTSSAAESYITGTVWQSGSYTSLKRELNLLGNVDVYALQLALKTLGYYTNTLDGEYGLGTQAAVKAFQRAYKLTVDGYAGVITQKVLYPLALAAYTGSSSSSSSTTSSTGTLKTTVNTNLRKSYSTKTARLAVIPKKTTLTYTNTTTSSSVTWYYVSYNNLTGWVMGTYVSVTGSSSSSSSTTETSLGTVTVTLSNTRIRTTANGAKSGYVLSKGSTATLLATPTTAGGYTWYYIKTSSGVKGYIRGDCATVSYDASTGVTPSTTKTYIKVSSSAGLTIFTTNEQSTTGAVTVPQNTVLQMVSTDTYAANGVTYCSVYYQNSKYNCVYANVSSDIMTSSALTTYITGTLWPAGYITTLKEALNLVGNINVHSLQYALTLLGFYTGTLDGNFGSGTTSAVRNFQRKYDLTVDGSVGPETSAVLFAKAIAALTGTSTDSTTSAFGTIKSIEMASWTFGDNGATLFPKGTTATVMDVETQMVFKIYRWSGAYHADCVPYDTTATKTMCDIVGFKYNSSHPTSAQLSKIKADTDSSDYIWPDFNGKLSGASSIGSKWDRRAALLNVGGRVFCVSIYGWPHGYIGTDSFSTSKFSDGSYFFERNNYYGMMCVHFVGSWTHTGSKVDDEHQASIKKAYTFAQSKWPSLVK